ncbi:hypothetical protein [Streptomyces yangpuensis]|uniref:hypothetical protein n=1 Tax=Streptomyces yangpuensis TaxID=1648182 RepID=UPI0037243EAA
MAAFAAVNGPAFGCCTAVDTAPVTTVLAGAEVAARDMGVLNIADTRPQIVALSVVAAVLAVAGALAVKPIRGVRRAPSVHAPLVHAFDRNSPFTERHRERHHRAVGPASQIAATTSSSWPCAAVNPRRDEVDVDIETEPLAVWCRAMGIPGPGLSEPRATIELTL